MWKEIYVFYVPDELKTGKCVCALDRGAEDLDVIPISGITVKRFLELQENRNVVWYVKEENNGEPDGTDE